jgi:magnesium-transporting ATPase (P-type)
VFFINGLSKGHWMDAFFFAIAVAVGLTPEMLPMIVNANLARGALTMSRQKVIVKQLSAIQNLGAMDILCTDKTGTLTQDRIILQYHLDFEGYHPAIPPGLRGGGVRARPGIRLPQQPLPVWPEEPAGRGSVAACATPGTR